MTLLKTILLASLMTILLTSFASAAILPYKEHCERRGYSFEKINSQFYCVFNENNRCLANKFIEGTCGEEFHIDLPCVQEGEAIWTTYGETCCNDLVAKLEPKHKEGYICTQENIFQRIIIWLKGIFS